MTANNNITPVQTTILRRVNRSFQMVPKGQKVEAVLPLPVEETIKGQMMTRTFDKIITIENTGKEFRAECYIAEQRKKTYWRKWRNFKSNLIRLSDKNFNALIKRLKDALYTEIQFAVKITEQQALDIINNRALIGSFWLVSGNGYTAIDNQHGEAFTEHFRTIEEVKTFLFDENFYVAGESDGFAILRYENG